MITTAQIVKEHLASSQSVMKKVLRSKRSASEFLVKAGICEKTKDGIRLAKPYR